MYSNIKGTLTSDTRIPVKLLNAQGKIKDVVRDILADTSLTLIWDYETDDNGTVTSITLTPFNLNDQTGQTQDYSKSIVKWGIDPDYCTALEIVQDPPSGWVDEYYKVKLESGVWTVEREKICYTKGGEQRCITPLEKQVEILESDASYVVFETYYFYDPNVSPPKLLYPRNLHLLFSSTDATVYGFQPGIPSEYIGHVTVEGVTGSFKKVKLSTDLSELYIGYKSPSYPDYAYYRLTISYPISNPLRYKTFSTVDAYGYKPCTKTVNGYVKEADIEAYAQEIEEGKSRPVKWFKVRYPLKQFLDREGCTNIMDCLGRVHPDVTDPDGVTVSGARLTRINVRNYIAELHFTYDTTNERHPWSAIARAIRDRVRLR
jgi:hypothetical protein